MGEHGPLCRLSSTAIVIFITVEPLVTAVLGPARQGDVQLRLVELNRLLIP